MLIKLESPKTFSNPFKIDILNRDVVALNVQFTPRLPLHKVQLSGINKYIIGVSFYV